MNQSRQPQPQPQTQRRRIALPRRRIFVLSSGVATLLAAGFLWFRWLSPWGYTPPAELAPIDSRVPHAVFAYGTLRNPLVRWLVIGQHVSTEPAILEDHTRIQLNILPQPGSQVSGETFVVDAEALRRLDRYERLGVRYERVQKTLASGQPAWVYRRIERP